MASMRLQHDSVDLRSKLCVPVLTARFGPQQQRYHYPEQRNRLQQNHYHAKQQQQLLSGIHTLKVIIITGAVLCSFTLQQRFIVLFREQTQRFIILFRKQKQQLQFRRFIFLRRKL